MSFVDSIVVVLIAALHVFIFYKEAFDWEAFAGRLMPKASAELLRETRALGLNQGLYNLILAIALLSSLWSGQAYALLFLACVVLAGVVGAKTVSPAIAKAQALPGAVGFVVVLLL